MRIRTGQACTCRCLRTFTSTCIGGRATPPLLWEKMGSLEGKGKSLFFSLRITNCTAYTSSRRTPGISESPTLLHPSSHPRHPGPGGSRNCDLFCPTTWRGKVPSWNLIAVVIYTYIRARARVNIRCHLAAKSITDKNMFRHRILVPSLSREHHR